MKKIRSFLNRHTAIVSILGVLVIPIGILAQTALSSGSFEVEAGTHSGGVSVVGSAAASGGNYVRFNSQDTTEDCGVGPGIVMGLCLNPASVPTAAQGASSPVRYRETGYSPSNPDGVGAFRTECKYSHVSRNDPIVFPGQKDATHWHIFFGNTAADENLTDPIRQGNSTCNGGTLNRTGYWAPALVDTNSYNSSTRTFNLVPVLDAPYAMALQVYYKSGYWGVESRDIEPFPEGLRMIAGADLSRPITGPHGGVTPFNYRYVHFDCLNSGHAQDAYNGIYDRTSIPTDCPAGKIIQARIVFPQCGAEDSQGNPIVDSPDHRSHMSYPLGWPDRGCPASHPRAYPEIIEHFRWVVPSTGSSGLRFSSDLYSSSNPAGWSFHADWWNGWDPATFQSIVDNCFHAGSGRNSGYDCSMNLVGPHPNGGWWALGTVQ